MEIIDYYCITSESNLVHLGEALDFDEAESIVSSLGIEAIWIFDQQVADVWLARLTYFKTLHLNDHSSQIPGQVLPSTQIQ